MDAHKLNRAGFERRQVKADASGKDELARTEVAAHPVELAPRDAGPGTDRAAELPAALKQFVRWARRHRLPTESSGLGANGWRLHTYQVRRKNTTSGHPRLGQADIYVTRRGRLVDEWGTRFTSPPAHLSVDHIERKVVDLVAETGIPFR